MDTCGYMGSIHLTTLYNVDYTYSHIFMYIVHASTQAKLYVLVHAFTGVTCTCTSNIISIYLYMCTPHEECLYHSS